MTLPLLAGLEVDGDMMRLARLLADRNGWTLRGVVQVTGLVATVPAAQLEDAHGALHLRTLEDLRAEKLAPPRAPRAATIDARTLSLF